MLLVKNIKIIFLTVHFLFRVHQSVLERGQPRINYPFIVKQMVNAVKWNGCSSSNYNIIIITYNNCQIFRLELINCGFELASHKNCMDDYIHVIEHYNKSTKIWFFS